MPLKTLVDRSIVEQFTVSLGRSLDNKKMLPLKTRQLWSVVTYEVLVFVFLEKISVLESYFWNFNELFLGHRQWSFQRYTTQPDQSL